MGLGKLKECVVQRHDEMESVLVQMEEKEENENEADEEERADDYGAEDKEKEALDANQEKVKMIRENLKENNKEWRGLLENVSADYQNMSQEKKKLVIGLCESTDELKGLLDLVCKIPKRKILEDANAIADDEQEQEQEEENDIEKEDDQPVDDDDQKEEIDDDEQETGTTVENYDDDENGD